MMKTENGKSGIGTFCAVIQFVAIQVLDGSLLARVCVFFVCVWMCVCLIVYNESMAEKRGH